MSKKHHYRKNGFRIPLAATLGSLAGIMQPLTVYGPGALAGDEGALNMLLANACMNYTGWDFTSNTFNFSALKNGLVPMIVGNLVSYGASKLGVNRRLAQAGVPFIRI